MKILLIVLKYVTLSILLLATIGLTYIFYQTKDNIKATPDTINSKIKEIHNSKKVVGCSYAVFNDKEIIYQGSSGYRDIDNELLYAASTSQYSASVSKVLIGIAIMQLIENKLICLDDPINKHIPFEIVNPNFFEVPITIRHLSTHTSSLAYNESVVESNYIEDSLRKYDHKDFIESYFVAGKFGPVLFSSQAPGKVYEYSNIGSALLAYLIEVKTKMPFADYVEQNIFLPLEMRESKYFYSEFDTHHTKYYEISADKPTLVKTTGIHLYSARDWITNLDDLIRLGQAVIGKDERILSLESYDTLLSPSLDKSTPNLDIDNMGIQWMIDRNQYGITYQLRGLNGGDNCINTWFWIDKVTNTGFVFLGNTGPNKANRYFHIMLFRTLESISNWHYLNRSDYSVLQKLRFRWHNYYSRVAGLF